MPTPIDTTFYLQLEALKRANAACGAAMGFDPPVTPPVGPPPPPAGRAWFVPDFTVGAWAGDPLDLSNLASAMSRDDLNAAYAAGAAGGTLADRMAAKIQVDYLAAAERAYRARHATPLRCAFHAAGRRQAQGGTPGNPETSYSVFDSVTGHVQNVIAAGAAAVPPSS